MRKMFAAFARRFGRFGGSGVVAYVAPGGPGFTPSYDFSDARNSMYIMTLPIF